jgi:hypothetical protein
MTKTWSACLLLLLAGLPQEPGGQEPAPQDPAPTFAAYDVFVDSGEHALGAWQFEWLVRGGDARIVGVEGGEHRAFAQAPHYDPAALQGGRIVVAAFSTNHELPRGKTRVARLHLRIGAGPAPAFAVELKACADGDGAATTATVTWQKME